ncbi:MAG TPA: NAD-dependent epimerase/dehydratase family protein, partial [Solirubrobacteraceae bacterium]|nr:NAD-dependent epimerase/dehydratase family protein [Solirubrobacteraceae bacterium]
LSAAGHDVTVLDNLVRRRWDRELGTEPLIPLPPLEERVAAWKELTGCRLGEEMVDLTDTAEVLDVIDRLRPEAIVHFGEQSSAPYSMMDADHAISTQLNNVVGTLNLLFAIRDAAPTCHLVKLGTMGEYGTPNIDIEEGYIRIEHRGRVDTLPYPKQPGSFYHLSKVHDSHNILFACRAWGLRATDLNQGIVYNVQTPQTAADPRLANRFDYDGTFGTAINRFCVQAALGGPLTVYGAGGQTRAFIDLRDTVRCVELAVLHPAPAGELRVFNQFTEQWSILSLARRVQRVAATRGLEVEIDHLENPRVEAEAHYYKAHNRALLDLGLEPHLLCDETVAAMLELTLAHRDRIRPETMAPTVDWRTGGAPADPLERVAVA